MYQPIFKSKPGELEAWAQVSAARRKCTVPLIELEVKSGTDVDLHLVKTCEALFESSKAGDTIAVDAVAYGYDAVHSLLQITPIAFVATAAATKKIRVRPVVRISDPATYVADAIAAAKITGEKIILRLQCSTDSAAAVTSRSELAAFSSAAGVQASSVHVVVDLRSVYGMALGHLVARAVESLTEVSASGTWASITLAAGAFPEQISDHPKGARSVVPRLDADLWNNIDAIGDFPGLKYGDYGNRYPDPGTSNAPRGPLPNLRYCTDTAWIIWREATLNKYPNSSFYDVCAGIVSQPEFSGRTFSWADDVIYSKSFCTPGPTGAGTGQQWITYGLSRHIEFVADRLSTAGVA